MKSKQPKYLYHGSAVNDILDIVQNGLLARSDRDGISVTTTAERARGWAGLKKTEQEIYVFRIPTKSLGPLIPETARPADPRLDFTVVKSISPAILEIRNGGKWMRLIDAYSELLDDDELEEWKLQWE